MAQGNLPPGQRAPAVPFEDHARGDAPFGEVLEQGKTLLKSGTQYVTAMSVQKPRNLDAIVEAIEKEAEYAGEKFWYRLPFGNSKVEGPSIGLATSLLREWGNNALVAGDINETPDSWLFVPRYIDLEKGVQLERAFRQRRSQSTGKMDSERAQDIAFQIGQSKAIRNLVVNALPKWLVQRAIAKAKAAVAKGITPDKLEEWKKAVVSFFEEYKVTEEQLVAYAEAPVAQWSSETIADFRALKEALIAKEITIDEAFPKEKPKAPEGPIKVETVGGTKAASSVETPQAGAKPPAAGGQMELGGAEPTAEEKAKIKGRELYESMPLKCETCKLFGSDKPKEIEAHIKAAHGGPPKASGKF